MGYADTSHSSAPCEAAALVPSQLTAAASKITQRRESGVQRVNCERLASCDGGHGSRTLTGAVEVDLALLFGELTGEAGAGTIEKLAVSRVTMVAGPSLPVISR